MAVNSSHGQLVTVKSNFSDELTVVSDDLTMWRVDWHPLQLSSFTIRGLSF